MGRVKQVWLCLECGDIHDTEEEAIDCCPDDEPDQDIESEEER